MQTELGIASAETDLGNGLPSRRSTLGPIKLISGRYVRQGRNCALPLRTCGTQVRNSRILGDLRRLHLELLGLTSPTADSFARSRRKIDNAPRSPRVLHQSNS